ncbi:MAG TPA: TolC family protein [Hyphomonadaceae bacterium]|nr:TolC family protein [Hyphomonadaceae bacterium]
MINKNIARGVSVGALAALLSACGHLPIAKPAFDAMKTERSGIPTDWTVAPMTGDTTAIVADYSVFNDPQLIAFVQESLQNNRTLRAAVENVKQSEAALKQTRSGLFPQVRASVGASESTLTSDFDLSDPRYSFIVNGSYDVDIMGDLSASIQASAAGLRSTEATYEQTRRSIAAQVARAYFAVIEQQLQLDLDQRSLERQRASFRITQTRFDAGSAARDELVLGQSQLATAEDSILAAQASLRSAVRALETALGRFPQNKLQITGTLPDPPAPPPLGLPELTVRSRPDVVAAELNMISTFAQTRIAKLAPWPQLSTDLTLGLQNTTVNTTKNLFDFDNLAFTIGATLAQTIFDGGAIQGRIDSANAAERRALETYGATIITAYGQIVDAIDQFNTLQSRNGALQQASQAAQEALRLGELKYNEGSQSLLDLFQVRDRADTAESALISNRRARLEQWIVLHTALGGNPTKSQPLPSKSSLADGGKHE